VEETELAARARTVAQLADIVQAMRTLASARRRQAQDRFSGIERYAAATRAALGQALSLLGTDLGPTAAPVAEARGQRRIITLFAEHGFVGVLNERLLQQALALGGGQKAQLVAVGNRGRRLCLERGIRASYGGPMPTTIGAVQTTAQRLIEEFFGAVAERRLGEMHVVFAAHKPPVAWAPHDLRLFPPDVRAAESPTSRPRPIHTVDPRLLVVRALEEYAFAQVTWAVGHAFASEQSARFVQMDAARHHIEDKLGELVALQRELRQETTTNEILEIASGSAASSAERP
jgi:F-type H+-transporting ATPase subunit gamma